MTQSNQSNQTYQERQGYEGRLHREEDLKQEDLKRIPNTWSKRILKICLTIIIPLIVLYCLVALAPYLIQPQVTNALASTIQSVWGISSIIQYGIYAAIAFYFYPRMAEKKRKEVMRNLYDIQNIRESSDYIEFSERELFDIQSDQVHFQKKLARIDQLMSLKVQWLVMSGFIVFDLIAGQLPYWLIIHQ